MGQTLCTAAEAGNEGKVSKLLNGGADIESRDSTGGTPLYCACRGGQPVVVAMLIKRGADLEAQESKSKRTPLFAAAKYGRTECARALLNANANVNAMDSFGQTPLHLAVLHGQPAIVSLLLEFNAAKDVKNGVGQSPLHWAAGKGEYLICEMLLAAGCNSIQEDDNGDTPLHRAAVNGHLEAARLLLRTGGPPLLRVENKVGKTPHDLSKLGGHGELALLLQPELEGELAKVADGGPATLGAGARASLASSGMARSSIRVDKRMSISGVTGLDSMTRHRSLSAVAYGNDNSDSPAAQMAKQYAQRHTEQVPQQPEVMRPIQQAQLMRPQTHSGGAPLPPPPTRSVGLPPPRSTALQSSSEGRPIPLPRPGTSAGITTPPPLQPSSPQSSQRQSSNMMSSPPSRLPPVPPSGSPDSPVRPTMIPRPLSRQGSQSSLTTRKV